MKAPRGLSGAPLIRLGTADVVGVIYGDHGVESEDRYFTLPSEGGAPQPEKNQVVLTSFALAHDLDTVRSLTGGATEGKTLAAYSESRSSS